MIDTHCHLYLEEFDNDREKVLLDALDVGVQRILVPGIDASTSIKSVNLSINYSKNIFSAVGIHPNYSVDSQPNSILELLNSHRDNIFAIGEIGLDYYRTYSPPDTQVEIFNKMLEFAKEFNLPICIHNRNADLNLIEILDKWYDENAKSLISARKGVFHAFDGSQNIADWGITHGFSFGIGGTLTYKKSIGLRNVVKRIGINNLVLETDAPYLSPVPFRGKRNTPQNLVFIVQSLAEIFCCNTQEVIKITNDNANRLFQFK